MKPEYTVFAYVFEGQSAFEPQGEILGEGSLILYGPGGEVSLTTGSDPVRFLLVSGKPLGEPIAWYGPIVMNTKEELKNAFEEIEKGSLIPSRSGSFRRRPASTRKT